MLHLKKTYRNLVFTPARWYLAQFAKGTLHNPSVEFVGHTMYNKESHDSFKELCGMWVDLRKYFKDPRCFCEIAVSPLQKSLIHGEARLSSGASVTHLHRKFSRCYVNKPAKIQNIHCHAFWNDLM